MSSAGVSSSLVATRSQSAEPVISDERDQWFDRPFDRLTVLSEVEGLTVLSEVEGLTVLSTVEGLTVLSEVEGESRLSPSY